MYSSRREPLSSTNSSFTSFSSNNSYIPPVRRSSPVVLRELVARDLDEINSINWNRSPSRQREPFRIPRPVVTIPRPTLHIPRDNSVWTLDGRSTHVGDFSSLPNRTSRTYISERPFYQIAPPPIPPPPPPPPPPPIQYQFVPIPFQRPTPIYKFRGIRQKKYLKEKTPGLCTTLCSGGFGTIAVLIYLILVFALPTAKLVLGILYFNECNVNQNIPIYMIVSGACGLGIILFLLLSSACTFYRSSTQARKSTHTFMICTIALARGMQGIIAIFLFIWFFVGNFWVFGVRYRVQTDTQNNNNNYCHPALYWFAFYVLIFTYVYAIFMCFLKFCANFLCCGACDIWKRAFS